MEPDEVGDLPLHVIARQLPPLDGGIDEDYELDFLNRVLELCPTAAEQFNHENHTALYVAIRSGRKWHSGIRRLLEANPAAIVNLALPRALLPRLFAMIQPSTIFGVLVAQLESFS